MTRRHAVRLAAPAHDMAREEIGKQLAFLARGVANVRFSADGAAVEFDAPTDAPADLPQQAAALARTVQRALRDLQRKVLFRSPAADDSRFAGDASPAPPAPSAGVTPLGPGQVALDGVALRLYRYFDDAFERFGRRWDATPVLTPTLIPSGVLARCDYFRSFPNTVTFACHLAEDVERINGFRARHAARDDVDAQSLADMHPPEACLSPAVCYHVYHMNQGRVVPAGGLAYGVCGRCFRYESGNLSDLRRLWDFTMREVVFLGGRAQVLARREESIEMMSRFLEAHDLAGEIRTASDPFFVAPDAVAKTYFQLSSETKFEISLMLPGGERLAAGSHNYHSDFFGRAFDVRVEAGSGDDAGAGGAGSAGAGAMHSVCVAFGLERWVYAFLAQHGDDPAGWPAVVRGAVG